MLLSPAPSPTSLPPGPRHGAWLQTARLVHDAEGFLAGELERRRALSYPPFSTLIRIVCSSKEPDRALEAAAEVQRALPGSLGPAPLFRLRGRERSQVVVKGADRRASVAQAGAAVAEAAAAWGRRGVAFSVDVDPQ